MLRYAQSESRAVAASAVINASVAETNLEIEVPRSIGIEISIGMRDESRSRCTRGRLRSRFVSISELDLDVDSAEHVGSEILLARPIPPAGVSHAYAAQQDSFATSLSKVCAASLIPSDSVRYGWKVDARSSIERPKRIASAGSVIISPASAARM